MKLKLGLITILLMALAGAACKGDNAATEGSDEMANDENNADGMNTETAVLPPQKTSMVRPLDSMTMVHIPAGAFLMGDDTSPFPSEKPQHLVTLDEFWIDKFEVTNAQFRLCVDDGVCPTPNAWNNPELNGDTLPVIVPWEDAHAYCAWVGERLPTEAEWEKAARGLDGRLWPWGTEPPDGKQANMNGEDDGFKIAAPVGSFPTGDSPFGVADMAGNAAEWMADWWDRDYYSQSPDHNPTGPASGEQKVIRSAIANWGGGPEKIRVIARYARNLSDEVGFRCVTEN